MGLQCQYLNFINKIDKMTIILRILPLLAVVSSSFANPTSEATSNFIEVKPTTTQIQKKSTQLMDSPDRTSPKRGQGLPGLLFLELKSGTEWSSIVQQTSIHHSSAGPTSYKT